MMLAPTLTSLDAVQPAAPRTAPAVRAIEFTPLQLALIIGISKRAVLLRLNKMGVVPVREEPGNGGLTRYYHLNQLPPEWRTQVSRHASRDRRALADRIAEAMPLAMQLPEYKRSPVAAWMEILQECDGLTGHALARRLVQLEERFPGIPISSATYYRKLKEFEERGIEGIAPAWGKTRGKTKIRPEWLRAFLQYYLTQDSRADLLDAHRKAFGAARLDNPDLTLEQFGSHVSYKRLLDAHMSPSQQYFWRHGEDAWLRRFKSHIDRDPRDILAGEVWVSDHHQLDVGCNWETTLCAIPGLAAEVRELIRDKKGKPKTVFPWVTVWRDFRTGKFLSYLIHEDAPNSDHVIYSLYLACRRFGVPQAILIDNGKDYRCKAFAGGRVKETTVRVSLSDRDRSVCRLLGIRTHFATPYNAKAKPVERDFSKFRRWFCTYLTGYRGRNTVDRPERLEAEIKAGKLMQQDELCDMFFTFVESVMNRFPSQGKYLKGLSPDEFWDRNPKGTRQVSDEELALCCMRVTEPRQITGRGVHVHRFKLDYYAPWMSTQGGRKVCLRIDLLNFTQAFVFDAADDRYLGRAEANFWQAKAFAKSEEESQRLRALLRMQGQQLKDIREIGRALGLGVEHLQPVKHTVAALEAMGGAVVVDDAPTAADRPALPAVSDGLTMVAEAVHELRRDKEIAEQGPFDISQLAYEPEPVAEEDETLYLFPEDLERAKNFPKGKKERAEG